jgi:hypothetical protein
VAGFPSPTIGLSLLDPKELKRHAFDLNQEPLHVRGFSPNKQGGVYLLGARHPDCLGYNQFSASTPWKSNGGT